VDILKKQAMAKRFQFSLRRVLLATFFVCVGLGSGKAAVTGPMPASQLQIILRFAYSLIAAAAFGAAVGSILKNTYNGFAIGVFLAFFLYLFGLWEFVFHFI
jgi:hypothetical protein